MRQAEIDKAVARATGESRRTVAAMGFGLWEPDAPVETQLHVVLNCPACGRLVRLTPEQYGDPDHDVECEGCDVAYPYQPEELFAVEEPAELLVG